MQFIDLDRLIRENCTGMTDEYKSLLNNFQNEFSMRKKRKDEKNTKIIENAQNYLQNNKITLIINDRVNGEKTIEEYLGQPLENSQKIDWIDIGCDYRYWLQAEIKDNNLYIHKLEIPPGHRRQKIATYLFIIVREICRKYKLKKIEGSICELDPTSCSFHHLVDFYRKIGCGICFYANIGLY